MQRFITFFIAFVIFYLSVSYWYFPNSSYSQVVFEKLEFPIYKTYGIIRSGVQTASNTFTQVASWFKTRAYWEERVQHLEAVEAELQQTKILLSEARKHIESLKPLLDFAYPKGFKKIAVPVYGLPIGFYESLMVTAAPDKIYITNDSPVIAEKGVIGRVVETSSHVLKVMLITDISSRIPVKILNTGENAILVGNGTSIMTLEYLQSRETVTDSYKILPQVGDLIITSGTGGIYPPNLPIGVVIQMKDEKISVKPLVDFTQLSVVTLLYENVEF